MKRRAALTARIRLRAYHLWLSGATDTLGNWLAAERVELADPGYVARCTAARSGSANAAAARGWLPVVPRTRVARVPMH